jgi:hypothetical protein
VSTARASRTASVMRSGNGRSTSSSERWTAESKLDQQPRTRCAVGRALTLEDQLDGVTDDRLEPLVGDRDHSRVVDRGRAPEASQLQVSALLREREHRDLHEVVEDAPGRPARDEGGLAAVGHLMDRAENDVGLAVEVVEDGAA